MFLELKEGTFNIYFVFKKVDPRKLAMIIKEANIIFKTAYRFWCMTPNIRVHKFKGKGRYTSGRSIGRLGDFGLLARITHNATFI